MTKQELNAAVKRLAARYTNNKPAEGADLNLYFKWLEDEIKPELRRLYHADTSLKSLTADNLRRLLRLNLLLRAIPFHQFGLYIDL